MIFPAIMGREGRGNREFMEKNIVLTGFMGTGKTAVGRCLADKTAMQYASIDEAIEAREKSPISEIFRLKGEKYFRKIERDMIKEFCSGKGRVIDCGGGAIVDAKNLKDLKASGYVFCLWAEPDVIFKRVRACSSRPLLNVEDPMKAIKELLEKRKSSYMKADFHIDTTNMRPEEVAEEIRRIVDAAGK